MMFFQRFLKMRNDELCIYLLPSSELSNRDCSGRKYCEEIFFPMEYFFFFKSCIYSRNICWAPTMGYIQCPPINKSTNKIRGFRTVFGKGHKPTLERAG